MWQWFIVNLDKTHFLIAQTQRTQTSTRPYFADTMLNHHPCIVICIASPHHKHIFITIPFLFKVFLCTN